VDDVSDAMVVVMVMVSMAHDNRVALEIRTKLVHASNEDVDERPAPR